MTGDRTTDNNMIDDHMTGDDTAGPQLGDPLRPNNTEALTTGSFPTIGWFPTSGWFPVARSDDAPLRHVHHAKLLGQELAVWRADDGYVNVWENRCLHRGVRLTVGSNTGNELKCLYHGWRYASRSGGCTYIPAHPANAPAQTICNQTFPTSEYLGLIWTTLDEAPAPLSLDAVTSPDQFDQPGQGSHLTLRSLPVNAPASAVRDALERYNVEGFSDQTNTEPSKAITNSNEASHGALTLSIGSGSDSTEHITFYVQPVDAVSSVVHSVLHLQNDIANNRQDQLSLLRSHSRKLNRIRRDVEETRFNEGTRFGVQAVQRMPTIKRSTADGGVAVVLANNQQQTDLRVAVAKKWGLAEGVVGFELAPIEGQLPTAQPGAHIDVELPNGLTRQYSLTNQAGVQDRYVIGVKLEENSRGGSSCLHNTIAEGDVLAISKPRNNFGLRRDAVRTVLVAGGIGITPLLGMAETLAGGGHPFELHYFARSQEHVSFANRLVALGTAVTLHLGHDPLETRVELKQIVETTGEAHHLYVCGPGAFLDSTRALADEAGWAEEAIHFEYFKNASTVDQSSSFDIELARSGLSLTVNANQSVLEVLRSNGITLDASCEQGACGTCVVGVLDGQVLHQDVVLNNADRALNNQMMTCVSRSTSRHLTLDI